MPLPIPLTVMNWFRNAGRGLDWHRLASKALPSTPDTICVLGPSSKGRDQTPKNSISHLLFALTCVCFFRWHLCSLAGYLYLLSRGTRAPFREALTDCRSHAPEFRMRIFLQSIVRAKSSCGVTLLNKHIVSQLLSFVNYYLQLSSLSYSYHEVIKESSALLI